MRKSAGIQPSIDFLKEHFRRYYTTTTVPLPDRFGRREFAFIMFAGKGMMRHIGFDKKKKVTDFLVEKSPQHAYYSSAYYKYPDASTMQEKEWMGAELIFDLDSDHLPNAASLTYEQSLEQVKDEFVKLVEDFLLQDFGIQKKYVELYFSGGRGYHCHVKDPHLLDLDSNERREIVDYITANGLRDSIVFRDHSTVRKQYGRRSYPGGRRLEMPTPDQRGWKGRISREIIAIVNEIRASDHPVEKLQDYGVKQSDAEKLVDELSEERVRRIKEGLLDQSRTIRRFFLNNALRRTAVSLSAGETDEPVTCDVKRLIRLPYSLHGKTGFQVVELSLADLADFDPLCDAVVFSDEDASVNLEKRFSISIKQQRFGLEKGVQKVPLYLAVFLIARRLAVPA